MEKIYRDEMKKNIDTLINDQRLKGKTVFVFGHCNATEEMLDYLLANGIAASAILDNNTSKQGFAYRGTPIISPSEIQGCSNTAGSIVLIAAKAYAQMAGQLRRLGYAGEIVKVVNYNSFAEYSLAEDIFEQKKQRVLRGMETLAKIRGSFPSGFLVICPYNALGDVYQALSFLPEYCRRHRIKESMVIVTGNACRQVAELFGVGNPLVLDREAMDELVQAVLFVQEKNCLIAHHDRPYTNNMIRWLNQHFLPFPDFYRYGVYGLDKKAAPAVPTRHKIWPNAEGIAKGRTVILSPYAKSMVTLPDTFWQTLAETYRQEGYLVCTNVAGDEKPVSGTRPLSIPIAQVVSAAEYAGLFIGIRSGLCDILATARCRKIVVFPDCFYSTTNVKVEAFFDLPGWEKMIVQPEDYPAGI